MMLAWLLFSAVVAVSSAGTVCGCQVVKEKLSNVLSANRNPGSLSPARRLHLGDEVLIVRITHVLPATPTTFVYDGTVTKVLYSANYETATGVKKIHQMHTDGGQKCFGSNLALPLGTYVMWGQFSHDKTIFYMDPCFIHGKDALLENFVKPLDDAKPFPELEATGGMPQSHIDAFQLTADTSNTVIITRGLNPLSAGLIEEGYAPKGFMNKAKSCNWGPMSGFVLNDPRMGKIPATLTGDARATAIAKQRAAIAKALDMDHFSLLVPVCVSTSRLDQLIRNKLVIVVRRDPDRVDVIAKQKGGELFHFALVKRRGLVGATGELWVVYYGKSESTREQVLTRDVKGRERPERIDNGPTGIVGVNLPESDLVPVLGIGNPESKVGPDREIQDATKIGLEKLGGQAYGEIYPGVRKAVAGDYDLWAVLDDTTVPSQLDFRRRVALSTPSRVGAPSATATELARENPNLGNISPAVREIGKDLNLRLRRFLVVHSDYGGNPFYDLDFPLVAFVPHSAAQLATSRRTGVVVRNIVCIQSSTDGKDKAELAAFLRLAQNSLGFCPFRAHPNLWDASDTVKESDKITKEWAALSAATDTQLRPRLFASCNIHNPAEARSPATLPALKNVAVNPDCGA